jgi:hypothetical protein
LQQSQLDHAERLRGGPGRRFFWCARAAKIFLAGREFGVSARLSVARSDVFPVHGVLDRRLSSGYGSATAT